MRSKAELLYAELERFVSGSPSGLLQLLVAAASRRTFARIISCPTYPAPARTHGLSDAVRTLAELLHRSDIHLPTLFARLYGSARTLQHRKRAGQFFTAAAVAEWALSIAPPFPTDHICDAGAGAGVFADAIYRKSVPVQSYTGVESDAILALCTAHVLETIGAPSSFRIWYANFLLLDELAFSVQAVAPPTLIIANPPFVRFHRLAGRARILMALKSRLGVSLSPLAGSGSYFLARAAELASISLSRDDMLNVRLLFFLPQEAAGAAHARRLRADLQRVHGWRWSEYKIPAQQTGIDTHRSNALALFFVFERTRQRYQSYADPSTTTTASVSDILEIKRGISTGC